MPSLSRSAIIQLLVPYAGHIDDTMADKLLLYLDLLLKWNARTNLTSIREPEEIVRRHFGESLFTARHLPPPAATLLDFGSGAGFPGLPIQLLLPNLRVTLAESQNKKASFLREAVRTLGLQTEVWVGRVEAIPADRQFDIVTMRAVDDTQAAVAAAWPRAASALALLTTARLPPPVLDGFRYEPPIPLPNSKEQHLLIAIRV